MTNKTPKTMRTANIRVSKVNSTTGGELNYTSEDIKLMVEQVLERYPGTRFAYIFHDKDTSADGPVPEHWHIVFKFSGHARFNSLKEVFPYGMIQTAKSLNASIQYLIHKNAPEKFQYQVSEIITNFSESKLEELLTEKDHRSKKQNEKKILEEIADLIKEGKLRDFNLPKYIDENDLGVFYSKNKNLIENLLQLEFKRMMMTNDRDIDVIFIQGEPGVGKTTYIDYLTKEYNGVCISSADNDMWQDYGGQDVMVLDDFRDSNLAYHELLKMIDNNKRSSVRGRYRNRSFSGKLIIITSVIPLNQWYNGKRDRGDSLAQLYRRIGLYIKMTEKEIAYCTCDEKTGMPSTPLRKTENPTYKLYKTERVRENKLISRLDSLINTVSESARQMGVEVSEIVSENDNRDESIEMEVEKEWFV